MFAKMIAAQLGNPHGVLGALLAPIWNRRNAALNQTAVERLGLAPDDRILEVGFGGGRLLARMAGTVTEGLVAGVDISPTMAAYCEKRLRPLIRQHRIRLICAAAESLPFPATHFTKICSINSIFYWSNAGKAFEEFRRVLRVEGKLVLCFTLKDSLEQKGFARHLALHDRAGVESLMQRHGFRSIETVEESDRHRRYACITGLV